jgi:hypothetical protein
MTTNGTMYKVERINNKNDNTLLNKCEIYIDDDLNYINNNKLYNYTIVVNDKKNFNVSIDIKLEFEILLNSCLILLKIIIPKKYDNYKHINDIPDIEFDNKFMLYLQKLLFSHNNDIENTLIIYNCICTSYLISNYLKKNPFNVELLVNKIKVRVCVNCKNISETNNSKMFKCSGCKNNNISYCSKECQKQDWKNHKFICGK